MNSQLLLSFYSARCYSNVALVACALLVNHSARLAAEVQFEATWAPPDYKSVQSQMLDWLEDLEVEDDVAFAARAFWPEANLRDLTASALLDRAVATFSLVHSEAATFIAACNDPLNDGLLAEARWLNDPSLTPLMRQNLRLFYARWLAHQRLYDEVLNTLADIALDEVIDPAGLLFYRMLAHHQVVSPEECRVALELLLEREDELPIRYAQVATLVRQDLAGLKDESLDHVARRMNDVRRRLEIGRAGKQVQVVEKGVVDSLDRMIEKLEQQQQQQQGSSGSTPQQSNKPMQDSQLPSMRAPMKVDQRDIGNQAGWGDLPAKQREQALQQIGRDFPTHYRELIEQYFRELAKESETNR